MKIYPNTSNPAQAIFQHAISRDYAERLRSLIEDGYVVLHETEVHRFKMCRLVHRSNGNNVILCAGFVGRYLWQRTNGKLTFEHFY